MKAGLTTNFTTSTTNNNNTNIDNIHVGMSTRRNKREHEDNMQLDEEDQNLQSNSTPSLMDGNNYEINSRK